MVNAFKLGAAVTTVHNYLDLMDNVEPAEYLDAASTAKYLEDHNLYPEYDEVEDDLSSILDSNRDPIVLEVETVRLAVSKLSRGKSSGISAWTYSLIQGLGAEQVENADAFITALTGLLNLMTSNKLDPKLWTKTRLVLILKPNGGRRPIAIGETLTRLLGACILRQQQHHLQAAMAPFQFGVGVKGGASIISMTCQMLINVIKSNKNVSNTAGIIPLDFTNAYGSVRRLHTGTMILKHIPSLFDSFLFLYGQSSTVHMVDGHHVATVTSGLRQGCSLAAVFFCISIKDILIDTNRLYPWKRSDKDLYIVPTGPKNCKDPSNCF